MSISRNTGADKGTHLKNTIPDKEFKILYKRFFPYIKKCTLNYISAASEFFDLINEQALVSFWIRLLRKIEKGMALRELENISKIEIYYSVKYSYYAVMRAKDVPASLFNRNKRIAEEELNALRLDSPKYSGIDEPDSLINYIIDYKYPAEKLLDLKRLTNKIMTESVLDQDVKAAVIRAELDDINIGKTIKEEEKIKLINEEYGLDVQSTKQLKEKAQYGIYKLYNAYSPEIKDILEMSDKNFRLAAEGKEVKQHRLTVSVKRCPVCGKAFISHYINEAVCADKKCKSEHANKTRKERRHKDRLKELINKASKADNFQKSSEFLKQALQLI